MFCQIVCRKSSRNCHTSYSKSKDRSLDSTKPDKTSWDREETICIHCKKNEQNSIDKKCPEYIKEKRINETIGTYNFTFFDAKQTYYGRQHMADNSENNFLTQPNNTFLEL